MTKFIQLAAIVIGVVMLSATSLQSTMAATVPGISVPKGLSIAELKFTGDEFIILQNNTNNALDVSNYWLTTFNNTSPLTGGVSSSTQQLPSLILQAGQTLLLSSNPMQTCGASVAGKLSVGLTDGGGFLQISSTSVNASGAINQSSGDFVSWSSGASGVIQNVPSSTKSPRAAYYRYSKGDSFAWQQADVNALDSCQLNIVVAGGSGSSSAVTPLNLVATSPPATIIGEIMESDGDKIAVLPSSDIGLTAPQISELLPNPVGTGNDGTDEFIELYNPNTKPFDLTGFTLETGLKTLKTYDFPEGTMIAAGAFKAFSAADTKLSLSNTSSQADLLDPFGNVIAKSEVYKTAKDGIGWVNANGKWYWTTKLTPGAANIVQQPVSKKKAAATNKKRTSRNPTTSLSAVTAKDAPNANGINQEEPASVVHYRVLALVGGLALLYGAYEYRRDISNRVQQFSSKLGFRRKARPILEGPRGD